MVQLNSTGAYHVAYSHFSHKRTQLLLPNLLAASVGRELYDQESVLVSLVINFVLPERRESHLQRVPSWHET